MKNGIPSNKFEVYVSFIHSNCMCSTFLIKHIVVEEEAKKI